jgi:transmembrane sensor
LEKEDFLILVEKYRDNNCTAKEKELVEYFFDNMQNVDSQNLFSPTEETGKMLLRTIKIQTGQTTIIRNRKRSKRILQFAAVFFIVAGLAVTIKAITLPIREITQTAVKGERKEIRLQDGSTVFLNSNSSITYPENFGETRQIKLRGEAYFKVHRDTTKPFVVSTQDVSVKVLGTSFNINSYKHNDSRVSVLTGKVEVTSPSGKKVILTKNLQANLIDNLDFTVSRVESKNGIAWTDNVIFLENTSLGETARIIENWYNIRVDFEDRALEKLTISGKFKDEKLENVLNSIALLKQLEIIYITKNHVLIRRNTTI